MKLKVFKALFLICLPIVLCGQRFPYQDSRGWKILFEDDMTVFDTGQTIIPQNSDIVLYATDFVKLENGFSVPLGSSLYIDVSDECR